MIDDARLERLLAQFTEAQARLSALDAQSSAYAAAARDCARLAKLAEPAQALKAARARARALDEERGAIAADPDLAALAEEEEAELAHIIARREAELAALLQEQTPVPRSRLILEVRAGTGGAEATLFAADLLRMYQRYAALKNWQAELISVSASETGGVREAVAAIAGQAAYDQLRFESGVHRVQRVPATESGGRIHTSAASVAILPEPEAHEVEIADKDVRIDVFRARGPGGQSVNTTDSAVRVTHLPSGLVVIQQDEKSQHKNRARALKVLRARLYEKERREQAERRASQRRGQIGSGDRSQRIRTYNFPQGRVTDHRLGLTLHALERILDGGLDPLIQPALEAEARRRREARLAAFAGEAKAAPKSVPKAAPKSAP